MRSASASAAASAAAAFTPLFNLAGEMCGSDGHASAAAGKANERTRCGPLSFLSENVKGEEAAERMKRRRKEIKKERKKESARSLSIPCLHSVAMR